MTEGCAKDDQNKPNHTPSPRVETNAKKDAPCYFTSGQPSRPPEVKKQEGQEGSVPSPTLLNHKKDPNANPRNVRTGFRGPLDKPDESLAFLSPVDKLHRKWSDSQSGKSRRRSSRKRAAGSPES